MRLIARLALAAVLSVIAATSASAQIPDSRAGRQLSAWLAAYNSGNRDTLLAFFQAHFPSRAPAIDDVIMGRTHMTGGYDFKKIESATPDRITGIMKMRNLEQYARFILHVNGDQIDTLLFDMIARPAEFPSPRTTESATVAASRQELKTESTRGRFSGAVIVAKDGRVLLAEAEGLADRERKIANTVETKFRMGSMNKAFTAVAALQLVQAGKVRLDAPIGTYLTDYPNHDVATKVTVAELLQHTGGTGDIFGPEFEARRLELRDLEDYVKLYGARGPEFEPGTRREYSNYGFILLGVIVQRVSGQSYYDYVRDHIFVPAHMTGSGSEPESVAVAGRAVGYTQEPDGTWTPTTDLLPYRGTSAGGGYTTVGDLLRFATALKNHTLLDAHGLDLFSRGDPTAPEGSRFPLGSGRHVWDGAAYFGHNGGFPGMNGDLEIGLDSGYVFAVLANIDPPAAERVSEFIGSRLPAK